MISVAPRYILNVVLCFSLLLCVVSELVNLLVLKVFAILATILPTSTLVLMLLLFLNNLVTTR